MQQNGNKRTYDIRTKCTNLLYVACKDFQVFSEHCTESKILTRQLTDKCKKALTRVFKICDQNNDGLLSDMELGLEGTLEGGVAGGDRLAEWARLVRPLLRPALNLESMTRRGENRFRSMLLAEKAPILNLVVLSWTQPNL